MYGELYYEIRAPADYNGGQEESCPKSLASSDKIQATAVTLVTERKGGGKKPQEGGLI